MTALELHKVGRRNKVKCLKSEAGLATVMEMVWIYRLVTLIRVVFIEIGSAPFRCLAVSCMKKRRCEKRRSLKKS